MLLFILTLSKKAVFCSSFYLQNRRVVFGYKIHDTKAFLHYYCLLWSDAVQLENGTKGKRLDKTLGGRGNKHVSFRRKI